MLNLTAACGCFGAAYGLSPLISQIAFADEKVVAPTALSAPPSSILVGSVANAASTAKGSFSGDQAKIRERFLQFASVEQVNSSVIRAASL